MMAKSKPPYPAEFRQQIVELVKAGRKPAELSKEFGCSIQTILNWIALDASGGAAPKSGNGLSACERAELIPLRREVQQLRRERIGGLMRLAGIQGVTQRGFVVTTERDHRQRPAPDLVNRKFVAAGPNQLWVADATYVPTWAGFIYLAIVLDVWSRRVVGWSIGESLKTDLMLAALNKALEQRKPDDGVSHHSYQGSQYTRRAFGKRCRELGRRP